LSVTIDAPKPAGLTTNFIVGLALVALGIRFGGLRSVEILAINMSPALVPADRVLVRGFGDPRAGDVVVYRTPFHGDAVQTGRVVAMPGQTVELAESGLLVDGKPVEVAPVQADDRADGAAAEAGPIARQAPHGEPAPGAEAGSAAIERIGSRTVVTRRTGGFSQLLLPRRTVAQGHLFVLNDNRIDQRDSRIYGAIPREAIVGVAAFVYYAEDEHGIRWDRMTRRVS
jgi:signal peptidase I